MAEPSPARSVGPSTFDFHQQFNRALAHFFPLFWTVTPPAVLRLLPGTSRRFGPPRRTTAWKHVRAQPGMKWRSVFPQRAEVLPPPFFCSDSRHALAKPFNVLWPEMGVAEIPHGRLLDEHAWTVGRTDTFLEDFCYNGHSRQCHVRRILKLRSSRTLPGRTLNLCSAHASINFFHFTLDALSRSELVRQAGYTWADFDRIVLPRFESPMAQHIIAALEIPEEKIMRIKRREQLECETLIQPTFPGPLGCVPSWIVDFYRRLFPEVNGKPERRVYFARRGNRHPNDEVAIAARLRSAGFESVDPLTVSATVLRETLAAATHVVGTHGASLANLVFCRPGTRVLELMPSEMAAHHNGRFYSTLCAGSGMPYGVVIGRSARHRITPYSPQNKGPFHIAMPDFERGLSALITT